MVNRIFHRKWVRAAYAAIVMILLAALFAVPTKADAHTYSITGKFYQSESRATLSLINDLRAPGNAWFWNSDNATKTVYDNLSGLTYDYGLEKIAMQRAAEIAVFYSHTRPDGSDTFSLTIDGVRSSGENIAISTGKMNSAGAFELWREEKDDYDGQGHRRNILNQGFASVGIAHFEYRGVHLFVQEFGTSNSGKGDPGACDTTATREVSVNTSNLNLGVTCQYASYEISSGGVADLPNVTIGMKPVGSYADGLCPGLEIPDSSYSIEWTSDNSSIVRVEGSKFIAGSPGTARLTATVTCNGQTAQTGMDVKVIGLDLSNLNFGTIPDITYQGVPVTIPFSINFNGKTLTEGVDYTLTFTDNNGPGTATFTITGMGNYTGKYVGHFKIIGDAGSATSTPTPEPATSTPTPVPATSTPTPEPATSTPTPTNSPTPEPTKTPTPEPTKTPTPKPATPTPKPATPTPKPTKTPTPKPTKTPTPKPTKTPTPKPTKTPTPTGAASMTVTSVPTETPIATVTPIPTATSNLTTTPVPTDSQNPTGSPEVTITPDITDVVEPTGSPNPTGNPETTGTPDLTGTPNPTDNPEPTESPLPTEMATLSVTPVPETTPTAEPEQNTNDPDSQKDQNDTEVNNPDDGKPSGGGNSTVVEFGKTNGSSAESKGDDDNNLSGWFWVLIVVLLGIIAALAVWITHRTKEQHEA